MTMNRRWLAVLLAAGMLLSACADEAEPGASPSAPSPSGSPTPIELEGSTCEPSQGGSDANVPDFVEVIPEHVEGIDRVTFRFEPDASATEAPRFNVQFVDQLTTDGEGAPVDVAGERFVSIGFHAIGVRIEGETPEEVYTGPREFITGYPNMLEIEQLGDFEAQVSWGIGLSRAGCYRVESSASEITLEFPSP